MKYNLTDKKLSEEGTVRDQIIEKHGFVPEFTLSDLEGNIEYTKKQLVQVKAKLDYEKAKLANLDHHHPSIKDIPAADRFAIYMYEEAAAFIKVAQDTFDKLEKQIEDDTAELAEIKEQIPELANIPSPFTPEVAAPAEEPVEKVEDKPTEETPNEETQAE